jgi:hypothetical protein
MTLVGVRLPAAMHNDHVHVDVSMVFVRRGEGCVLQQATCQHLKRNPSGESGAICDDDARLLRQA